MGFLISVFIFIAFLATGAYVSSRIGRPNQPIAKAPEAKFNALANSSIVYGYWTENNSKIEAVDLSSGKIYGLASLSKDIKKVTILTPDNLIFINKTNDKDHGQDISSYSLPSKQTTQLIKADEGFGIDDYTVSPNKRYIAVWEIKVSKDSQQLVGGVSRVYTVDLRNPNQKNLIYDEPIQEGVAVNYPLAITDSGALYLDKFKANSGAGWANGMSVSNLSGSQKQDISSMSTGTYSTQPILSPDGRYLAFVGYDGSKGAGVSVDPKQGFNQAFLNPNTIEILDTTTNQRQKLATLPSTDRYGEISWDSKGNIIFILISKDSTKNGYYNYNIGLSSFARIMDSASGSGLNFIAELEDKKLLVGKADASVSSVGNLGKGYYPSLGEILVYNLPGGEQKKIGINKALVQFIDNQASNYFNNSLVIGKIAEGKEEKQLQLKTFELKPTLAPKRLAQQSDPVPQPENAPEKFIPKCRELASAQCNTLMGTTFKDTEQDKTKNPEYNGCFRYFFVKSKLTRTCADSPLYLYGKAGAKVEIKIGTEIFNEIPEYKNGYDVTLFGDCKFNIGDAKYSSILFDYYPAIKKIPAIDYGRVVKAEDIDKTLDEYGKKLGLTQIEINDLKSSVIGQIDSPYTLVSFFDDQISKRILPISFTPAPDVYRNIVFYFKPLSALISIKEPEFEKIPERAGFTAVEVSHIMDR